MSRSGIMSVWKKFSYHHVGGVRGDWEGLKEDWEGLKEWWEGIKRG